MTVQLRINIDDTLTILEIPEVNVIKANDNKIQLSLEKRISTTLKEEDIITILIAPKDDLKITDRGYTILVDKASIIKVSL